MASTHRTTISFLELDNEILWHIFSNCCLASKLTLIRTSRRLRDIVLQCNEGINLRAPPSERLSWTDEQWWKDVDSALKSTRLALNKAMLKTKPLVQLTVGGQLPQKSAKIYTIRKVQFHELQQRLSVAIHLKDLSRLTLSEVSIQHTDLQAFVYTFPQLSRLVLDGVSLPWLGKQHQGSSNMHVAPPVHHNLRHLELVDCAVQKTRSSKHEEQSGASSSKEEGQSTASSSCPALLSFPGVSCVLLRNSMYFAEVAGCLNPAVLSSLNITRHDDIDFVTQSELQGATDFSNISSLIMDTKVTDYDMDCIFRLPKLQHLQLTLQKLHIENDYSSRSGHIKTLVFIITKLKRELIQILSRLPLDSVPSIEVANFTTVDVELPDADVAEFTRLTRRFVWPERQPGSGIYMTLGTSLTAQLLKYVELFQLSGWGWPCHMQNPLVQAILSESQHRRITHVPELFSKNFMAKQVRAILPPMCSYRDGMVWGPQPAILSFDGAAEASTASKVVAEVLDLVLLVTCGYIAIPREEAEQQLKAYFNPPHEAAQLNNHLLQLKQATLQWTNQGIMLGVVDILLNCFGVRQLQAMTKTYVVQYWQAYVPS